MTLFLTNLTVSQDKFAELFPLEKGGHVVAGGKRAGQTAGMARYTVIAGKNGREHILELGYGTVPTRKRKQGDYPLLLPKLDSQLGRFNIDGNTNNLLILKFREREDRQLILQKIRNFNAPCEIEVQAGSPNEKLAQAVVEIASMRVHEIIGSKINLKQDPQALIKLIHHAIEMRTGHVMHSSVG